MVTFLIIQRNTASGRHVSNFDVLRYMMSGPLWYAIHTVYAVRVSDMCYAIQGR